MLTASALLFLVLNLAPSPTRRLFPHAVDPAACFAVAAAADAPNSLRCRKLRQQPAQGSVLSKPPSGKGDPTSFAALVWGNNSTTTPNTSNAPTANQLGTGLQYQQPQQGTAKDDGSDDARYMIHLRQVNSSSWRDPSGVTFYQAEYRASNTASRDICDVKVGIPLGEIDPSKVQINNSYALKIEEPSSAMTRRSSEQGNMLTAALQVRPPIIHARVSQSPILTRGVDMNINKTHTSHSPRTSTRACASARRLTWASCSSP